MGAPDTKHIHYPAALGLGELPSTSAWARDPGHPHLWNEDRDSTSGSVSALSSPGGLGRFPGLCARGAGPAGGWRQSSGSRPRLRRSLSGSNQWFRASRFLGSKAERGAQVMGVL